jgi:hypothetical protein
MTGFAMQGARLRMDYDSAFAYIADPARLPEWTNAFKRVDGPRALLQTPSGACEIGLRVEAAKAQGTIDWVMTFPDGSVERACSRLLDLGDGSCAYTFVLSPPKAPLEQLEGTLDVQARTLALELAHLQHVLQR